MDEEKINAIGNKLEVGLSDIKRNKKEKILKVLYGITQGLIVLASAAIGENSSNGPYPFFSGLNSGPGLLFLLQFGNGAVAAPKNLPLGLSRTVRLKIFLVILFASIGSFIFFAWLSYKPPPLPLGVAVAYSAYDRDIPRILRRN